MYCLAGLVFQVGRARRRSFSTGTVNYVPGKDHIYYRIRDTRVEIIDVLHQSMEPKIHIG